MSNKTVNTALQIFFIAVIVICVLLAFNVIPLPWAPAAATAAIRSFTAA